jgi:hypothetical protein
MNRPTDMYDLLAALDGVVRTADPSKRACLAETIDAYCNDFSNDFFWATGPRAPTFLSRLLLTIDSASHSAPKAAPETAPVGDAEESLSLPRPAEVAASVETNEPFLFISS